MSDAADGRGGETALVAEALIALSAAGCMVWRHSTGKMQNRRGQWVSFGLVGSGDIIGVMPDGRFLSAEAKVGYRKPTPQQSAFAQAAGKRGGVAVWFTSVADLIQALGL